MAHGHSGGQYKNGVTRESGWGPHSLGQSTTPTFATGMEEVASIADAEGHGTQLAAETTGPCPQYPSKPPPGRTGVISALGQDLP
jgi:hypothetical protein